MMSMTKKRGFKTEKTTNTVRRRTGSIRGGNPGNRRGTLWLKRLKDACRTVASLFLPPGMRRGMGQVQTIGPFMSAKARSRLSDKPLRGGMCSNRRTANM
jgi:hypothetical protein